VFGTSKMRKLVGSGLPDIYPRLWRYCYVLGGSKDQADELAQATSIRALEKADSFQEGSHLDRWLFTSCECPSTCPIRGRSFGLCGRL